jgi:hypothetical protein
MIDAPLPVLPAPIAAHLCDQVGPAGLLSPRRRWGTAVAPGPRQAVELAVYGIIESPHDPRPTPEFAAVAARLLSPPSIVELRIWQGTDVVWTTLVGDAPLVAATDDEQGGVVISGPFGPAELARLLAPITPMLDADPGVELELHVELATALALAAAVDLARTAIAAGEAPGPFDRDRVVAHASVEPAMMPSGSLRLQTVIMGRGTALPTADAIASATQRLIDGGPLVGDDRSVGLGPVLGGLTALLPELAPCLRWQRRSLHGTDGVSTTDRIVCGGLHGLLLEISLGAEGFVTWRTRHPADFDADIARELAIVAGSSLPS